MNQFFRKSILIITGLLALALFTTLVGPTFDLVAGLAVGLAKSTVMHEILLILATGAVGGYLWQLKTGFDAFWSENQSQLLSYTAKVIGKSVLALLVAAVCMAGVWALVYYGPMFGEFEARLVIGTGVVAIGCAATALWLAGAAVTQYAQVRTTPLSQLT